MVAPRLRIVAVLAVAAACGPTEDVVECVNNVDRQLRPLEAQDFVAHAGGSPRGLVPDPAYTNSRQALEVSYANGFRAFELDFITLGDGTVVAAHDGHEDHYGMVTPFREATRDDLEGRRYDGRYDLMFAEDVVEWIADHPDVWMIVDSKWDHALIAATLVDLAPDDSVRDRLVPHLDRNEYRNQLAVYEFPEAFHATYRWPGSDTAIVQRMIENKIDNVMMWWDSRWNSELQAMLDEHEFHTWVHTPRDPEVIHDFLDSGIHVYSDGYIAPCE